MKQNETENISMINGSYKHVKIRETQRIQISVGYDKWVGGWFGGEYNGGSIMACSKLALETKSRINELFVTFP